jgi:hypothetical protein
MVVRMNTLLADNKKLFEKIDLHLKACHDPKDCPYCVQFEDELFRIFVGIERQPS